MDKNEVLAEFKAIASTDDATALRYLEMSDWDMSVCIFSFILYPTL